MDLFLKSETSRRDSGNSPEEIIVITEYNSIRVTSGGQDMKVEDSDIDDSDPVYA